MGIVVDVIIILIFALCIFNGYRKGLVKSLLKLLTSVLAIIIAIVLHTPLVDFVINNTTIDNNIQLSIENIINQNNNDNETDKEIVSEDSSMPKPIVNYLNSNLKDSVEEQKQQAITEVSKNTAIIIVNIGCILIIYILVKIILKILTIFVDIFAKIPVIKQFNELGGIIYGILEALIIILIVLTLISVIAPLIGSYEISNIIQESYIGKFLYNSNIFLNLIF